MNPVVSLEDRRRESSLAADEPLRCRRCGSEWFRLQGRPNDPEVARNGAVALAQDRSITAYAGVPVCLECGELA
jgi:DNA-directed RNA polymerase subunit RPC12/RpoP